MSKFCSGYSQCAIWQRGLVRITRHQPSDKNSPKRRDIRLWWHKHPVFIDTDIEGVYRTDDTQWVMTLGEGSQFHSDASRQLVLMLLVLEDPLDLLLVHLSCQNGLDVGAFCNTLLKTHLLQRPPLCTCPCPSYRKQGKIFPRILSSKGFL